MAKKEQAECPACRKTDTHIFYRLDGVPVHDVLVLRNAEEARAYRRGDIALQFCRDCGFIWNSRFDEALLEYSEGCEETQGYSETFQAFQHDLAEQLITRYGLRNKQIVEIGCGKGEFLAMLCVLGGNRGVGFDPAFAPERNPAAGVDGVKFIREFYSERYSDVEADFVCCKMTLEHIPRPVELLHAVRGSIRDGKQTVVFLQVPDAVRILRDFAFWDIYYEHCSYFSLGSLARLFRNCGFEVLHLEKAYDGQYVMAEARLANGRTGAALPGEHDLAQLCELVFRFEKRCGHITDDWKRRLAAAHNQGHRVVVWGGGSKAVAFLTTLRMDDAISYIVDINPHKHGTYLVGTGHPVVGPEFLREYMPDMVLVMNPIYREEIQRELRQMGLEPQVLTV